MKIIPAIDIIDAQCVRLTQGDYGKKTVYNEDPLQVARQFEDAGLQHLHLVDLDGAKAGKVINWKVVESICAKTTLAVDFGGGIKTGETIRDLLSMGVKQVNVGSIAVRQPELVTDWLEMFSPERIILSADVKGENIAIHGWQEKTATNIYDFVESFTRNGLHYVTCTDIGRDGMLNGPSLPLYTRLLHRFPMIRLTASGGVSGAGDLDALQSAGLYAAIVGKAYYEGKISLKEMNR